MTGADPTLEALKALDDPSRWKVVKAVPVFAPHKRKTRKKNRETGEWEDKEIQVTEADLHDIVRRARALEADGGSPPGLWLGHRSPDPDFPEEKQPALVGFARKWR